MDRDARGPAGRVHRRGVQQAGRAELTGVPAGTLLVRVNRPEASGELVGRIEAGRETDLGQLAHFWFSLIVNRLEPSNPSSTQAYRRSGFAAFTDKGDVLPNVPDGSGTVILHGRDYCGTRPLALGDQTVRFDPAQSGKITGRVVRADKSPAARVRVTLSPVVLVAENVRRATGGLNTTTDADGDFRSHPPFKWKCVLESVWP
jgi:hypothetical protein